MDLAAPGVRKLKAYQPRGRAGRSSGSSVCAACVSDAVAAGFNQYAPMQGSVALRAAIAAKIKSAGGREVDPETELTVTCGGTESIYSAIQAVVGAGDEAIVFDPAYDAYDPAIRLAGGRCIHIPLEAPHFRFDWDRVRGVLSERTRLVFIANPNNPTGTWLERDALRAFLERVPAHALVVIDEAYSEYVTIPEYPNAIDWIAQYPNVVVTRTSPRHGKVGTCAGFNVAEAAKTPTAEKGLNVSHPSSTTARPSDLRPIRPARPLPRPSQPPRSQISACRIRRRWAISCSRSRPPARPVYESRRKASSCAGRERTAESSALTIGRPEHSARSRPASSCARSDEGSLADGH
jgi:hypothetical protein